MSIAGCLLKCLLNGLAQMGTSSAGSMGSRADCRHTAHIYGWHISALPLRGRYSTGIVYTSTAALRPLFVSPFPFVFVAYIVLFFLAMGSGAREHASMCVCASRKTPAH